MIWSEGADGYERPFPKIVSLLGRTTFRAVVVGANSGFYCLVLGLTSPLVRVDALEPVPGIAARMTENLELNRLVESVVVHVVAAAAVEKITTMFVPPADPHKALVEMSASLSATFKDALAEEMSVNCTTVDVIRSLDARPIDLLIIDAEGCNLDALRGATQTAETDAPIIVTELTGDEVVPVSRLIKKWGGQLPIGRDGRCESHFSFQASRVRR